MTSTQSSKTESVFDWQKQRITIPLRSGRRARVNAQVLGRLAVHRSRLTRLQIVLHGETHTVTHTPTGFGVCVCESEPIALEIAKELQRLDWEFQRPEDLPAKTKREAPKIIARVKKQKALPLPRENS
jgi:hypothetical protein